MGSKFGLGKKEGMSEQKLAYVPAARHDVLDSEFRQTHFLRFEIDRSRLTRCLDDPHKWEPNPDYRLLKITDVDLYLEGNKHSSLQKH